MQDIKFVVNIKAKKNNNRITKKEVRFLESKQHEVMSIWWTEGKIQHITVPHEYSCITVFTDEIDYQLLEVI